MAILENQLSMKRTFSQREGCGNGQQATKKRAFMPCTGPLQMALVHHRVHSKTREQCATDLEHAVRQCVVTTPEFSALVSTPTGCDWQDVLRAADEVAFYVFTCSDAQAEATSMITDALCAVQHSHDAYNDALAAFACTLVRDSVRLMRAVDDAYHTTGWSRVSIVALLRKCYAVPTALAREGNVSRDIAAMVAAAEFLQDSSLSRDMACENASRACILAAPGWLIRMEKTLCAQVVREAREVSAQAAVLNDGAIGARSSTVLMSWVRRTLGWRWSHAVVTGGEQHPMNASERVDAAEDVVLAGSSLIGPLMHRIRCCRRLMYAPDYEGVAHPWVESAVASMRAAVEVLRGCGEFNTMLGRGSIFSAIDVVLLTSFACIALRYTNSPPSKQTRTVVAMRSLIIRVHSPGARAASLISVNDVRIGLQRFAAKEARPAQRALLAQVTRMARMLFTTLEHQLPVAVDVLSSVMATEAVVSALQ